MNTNIEYVWKLVDSVLNDKTVPKPPENVDWGMVTKAAGAGDVYSIIYNKLNELQGEDRPPESQMEYHRNYVMRTGMMKLQRYDLLFLLLEEAKKRKIEVVVFKGPILGELYPEPMLRSSCDIDLFVSPKDLPAFETLLVELGYQKNEEHSKENVPVYIYQNILMIEAHCCLYEDYTGKRIQMLEKMELNHPDKRIHMKACGLEVTTLGYEEHLIFLLFHIIKHISYSGCSIKTMVDIILYVNRYIEYIPKEDFWQKMKQLGYDTFCRTLFSIGCCYFGMTKEIFIDDSYSENIARTMVEQLYETGILKYDLKNEADRRASSIAFQSFYDKEEKSVGKFQMVMKSMFPKSQDLSFRYMYARKHPSLVWVAWLHRAINQIGVKLYNKEKKAVSMIGDVKLANQKLSLLRDLDLMGKD